MDRPTCSQLRIQLQEIKYLKRDFDLELLKIKDTRDTELALNLEKEIKEGLASLRDFFLEQQIKAAEQIMGRDFLGPEAIETTFSFKPETKDIPDIPFSKPDLERAKELGQFLILRVDKAPDGRPLTMENMEGMLSGEFVKEGHGKIFDNILSWYKDEDFFKKDTPKLSWSLVSKEVIPNSTNKKYLEQTEVMAKYLENKVFKDQIMPPEYQEAISEFTEKKSEIQRLMNDDWKKAAQILAELSINKLTRQSPSACIYDLLIYFKSNRKRLMEEMYTWTSSRTSVGGLVYVGRFDVDGVVVGRYRPGRSDGLLGASFSRSL